MLTCRLLSMKPSSTAVKATARDVESCGVEAAPMRMLLRFSNPMRRPA